jgi:mRNA interferase MazF
MRRGEIWWAQLAGPASRRPVLLLTRNAAYAVRTSVTIAPLTTTIRDIPVEVRLGPQQGLPRQCVVNLDEVQTIRKERLIRVLTTLSPEVMVQVDQALKFALGLK